MAHHPTERQVAVTSDLYLGAVVACHMGKRERTERLRKSAIEAGWPAEHYNEAQLKALASAGGDPGVAEALIRRYATR